MMVGEEVFETKETGAPTAPNEIVLLTALFNALFSDQWEAVLDGRLKFGGGDVSCHVPTHFEHVSKTGRRNKTV